MKFGGDLDVYVEIFNYPLCQVGCMSVYSPESTRNVLGASASIYAPDLPSTIGSTEDILNLPAYFTAGGITSGFEAGPGITPGPWHFESERRNLRPRVFAQDFWSIRRNLTLNYGLAYQYESGVYPSDMPLPGLLAPIFGQAAGTQLPPVQPNKKDFSPAFGFAYSPGKSGKTVIRGGAGIYWDVGNFVGKLHNQAYIGPVGNGPVLLPATLFTNTFPGMFNRDPAAHWYRCPKEPLCPCLLSPA